MSWREGVHGRQQETVLPYTHSRWLCIPPFVGNDYYCSTAYSGSTRPKQSLATRDPLFDGVGVCAGTCCDNVNQPWFKKTVPQQTTDNLEMRLCVDQPFSDEAVAFDQMELYIRVD